MLECLRLSLHQAVDTEDEEEGQTVFAQLARLVVQGDEQKPSNSSAYWQKCLAGMKDIEDWLARLQARFQTVIMTGQATGGDWTGPQADALRFQSQSLIRQHESLGAIMSYLIQGGHTTVQDFRSLITKASTLQNFDSLMIHHVPSLIAGATEFGSGASTTLDAARDLHKLIAGDPEQLQWKSRMLQAAIITWWLAEYSSRYADPSVAASLQGVDIVAESLARAMLFMEALRKGAFHLMLAICNTLKPEVWHDPAKVGLVRFLLEDAPTVPPDFLVSEVYLAGDVMLRLQMFADAFISNMPDTLRRLKVEEDEERRNLHIRVPQGRSEYWMDLERFILITAYAYQDPPDAAQDFWSDQEGNLYGFLQWISRRLPTPRVAVFCEMLRSLAGTEDCATQVHHFLLEDTSMPSGKLRTAASVSWTQIFSELEVYAQSISDKPAVHQSSAMHAEGLSDGHLVEPESAIMLEAYLRLAAHLLRSSSTVREWVLYSGQPFQFHTMLFKLAKSGIEPRLHACVWSTLSALLTRKAPDVGDGMWLTLDDWITKPYQAATAPVRGLSNQNSAVLSERGYLAAASANVEEATAFVGFLQALIEPAVTQVDLTDALPFPERLGSAHRDAGIEPYVDFVLGQVFAQSVQQTQEDETQLQVLRFNCLDFVCTCLSTFNEDLVLLANGTNIAVDATIATSSLAVYARLHPFARVMEWMFNDQVVAALFATTLQDVEAVSNAPAGSPLVQAILKSIEAIDRVMQMQATYFDIVRPIVKTQSTPRSATVANATLASFDDAILAHLNLVLGLSNYCATPHQALTLASLHLLAKLSASRKLSSATSSSFVERGTSSRLVNVFQQDSEATATALLPAFQFDPTEFEAGVEPETLSTTRMVLDVLNTALGLHPDRPTIAHCLLGFDCGERTVSILPSGAFAHSNSLFHAVVTLAASLPESVGSSRLSWLLSVKRSCFDVLLALVKSPMTSGVVTRELRTMDFLNALMMTQTPVSTDVLWDAKSTQDADFLLGDSPLAMHNFFLVRAGLYQYAAHEIKAASQARAPSVLSKVASALLGLINLPSGEQSPCPTVFDLLDFFDLDNPLPWSPSIKLMTDLDLTTCRIESPVPGPVFDVKLAREVLLLRSRELKKSGAIQSTADEEQLENEFQSIPQSLLASNQSIALAHAKQTALASWTNLVTLMLHGDSVEPGARASLCLQTLQLVLPKFERSVVENQPAAVLLARLSQTLIKSIAGGLSPSSEPATKLLHDRLLQAFRICLEAITNGDSNLELREACYQISSLVLRATAKAPTSKESPTPRQGLALLQSAGDRLMAVICEDALFGQGTGRVSAMLLLDAFVQLCRQAKSPFINRALTKLNFINVIVESIGTISSEFQTRQGQDLTALLSYVHIGLSLLLRLCQTQDGATLVLNAGLFTAVRDSQLFSTDPDIGLDIDNPKALVQFYRLLASLLQVITSVVLAKGPRNQQTAAQARAFLQENRFCMQAVFKRASKLGKTAGPPEEEVFELVQGFSTLIAASGFLEVSFECHS